MSIALSPPELLMMLMLWLPMQPAGQPAPAATVFRYVPAQANATLSLDVGSVTASALGGFRELGRQSFVKRSQALSQRYAGLDQRLARGLKVLQLLGGLDPFKDVRWLTVSLALRGAGKPDFVIAAGGKLPAMLAERIAGSSRAGAPESLPNGKLYVSTRPSKPSVGWTKDDVLLVGIESMLRPLLERKPRPTALSRLASTQHDGQSFCTAAFRPGKSVSASMPAFLRSLGRSFDGVVLAMRYDGLRLGFAARDRRPLTHTSRSPGRPI